MVTGATSGRHKHTRSPYLLARNFILERLLLGATELALLLQEGLPRLFVETNLLQPLRPRPRVEPRLALEMLLRAE